MEIEKTFMEIFKEVFEELKEERLVTQEEIERGFEIPLIWLTNSGIHRDAVIRAMRNLYEKAHPNNGYPLGRFKKLANLKYSEKDGKPYLEVWAGKSSIVIADEKMELQGYRRDIDSNEFMKEINRAKKHAKKLDLMNQFNIPIEKATEIVDTMFDSQQTQSDFYSMPHFLKEMAINFRDYFRALEIEKQEIEKIEASEKAKADAPIETRGGIIEQTTDVLETVREQGDGSGRERVSDIYPFEERDKIFRDLKPKRIIIYDGVDRNGQIVRNAYTCYIYKAPQGQNGYLGISEPLNGDKEARAFYLSEELIEGLQENEDLDKFWHTIGETYIGMSRSEFTKEQGTYRFKHSGDLESYRQRMEGVIKDFSKSNSQRANVKRALLALFGKDTYSQIIDGVTRSELDKAREAMFGERIKDQTNEGVGIND